MAGDRYDGCSGDYGHATSVGLNYPKGLAVDSQDDIFIAASEEEGCAREPPPGTDPRFLEREGLTLTLGEAADL